MGYFETENCLDGLRMFPGLPELLKTPRFRPGGCSRRGILFDGQSTAGAWDHVVSIPSTETGADCRVCNVYSVRHQPPSLFFRRGTATPGCAFQSGDQGFEPRLTDPETVVLPLH